MIAASQNHTFSAENTESAKFAVRVTPDPLRKHQQRVEDEVMFVNFISKTNLHHVCSPIVVENFSSFAAMSEVSTDGLVVRANNLIIVVFSWAIGNPLGFLEYRWMLDLSVVRSVGIWLASFHQYSRDFTVAYPEVSTRIQGWNQVHDGVLSTALLDPRDEAVVTDPQHFGVIHGDLNCSNYFYDDVSSSLSVFDWDQTQRGWFLWDVAQAVFTVVMLSEAGLPISCTPVPEANPQAFIEMIVSGYESVAGAGSVDRSRLDRMVQLRMQFYELFCRRATAEGDIPADMAAFIAYIVDWFDRKVKSSAELIK